MPWYSDGFVRLHVNDGTAGSVVDAVRKTVFRGVADKGWEGGGRVCYPSIVQQLPPDDGRHKTLW